MLFERLENRATGFMGVGAIRETAVFREMEDLAEVTGKFLGFHVEGAKTFNTWRIDNPPPTQGYHFRKGGGVLTEVMGIGDLCGAQVDMGNQTVDERGFTHSAVATEESDLPFKQGT